MTLRVILADDAVLIREGIARILTDHGFDVILQVGDAPALIEATDRLRPDIVVTDIRMPPHHADDGLHAAAHLKRVGPTLGVVVLSQYLRTRAALELFDVAAGGLGYLLKERVADVASFVDAVERVASGDLVLDPLVSQDLVRIRRRRVSAMDHLTARELDVLGAMAQGMSNERIADDLGLGVRTVESHVRSIFLKLDLAASPDQNRRVRAVLAFLGRSAVADDDAPGGLTPGTGSAR